MDRYVENLGAAPETYEELLVRTSGVLLHERSTRERERRSRRGGL